MVSNQLIVRVFIHKITLSFLNFLALGRGTPGDFFLLYNTKMVHSPRSGLLTMPPKDKTVDSPLFPPIYLENDFHPSDDDVPNIPDKFDDEYDWEDFLLDNADSYDDFFLKD